MGFGFRVEGVGSKRVQSAVLKVQDVGHRALQFRLRRPGRFSRVCCAGSFSDLANVITAMIEMNDVFPVLAGVTLELLVQLLLLLFLFPSFYIILIPLPLPAGTATATAMAAAATPTATNYCDGDHTPYQGNVM